MENKVYIDKGDIYDILCNCGLMTMYSKEYGSLEMLDEDEIMEDFLPMVIEYINQYTENEIILV
jgi:hypothetical protein